MRKTLVLLVVAAAMTAPVSATAASAKDILEKAQEKQMNRWDGVDTYLVEQTMMGMPLKTYYQRTEIVDNSGKKQTLFLPASEYAKCVDSGQASMDLPGVAQSSEDAQEAANYMADFINSAQLVGNETVDGRKAYHLQAAMNETQTVEGRTYQMTQMNIYIDADKYVPVKMKIDGTMSFEGETNPLVIERLQTDYRKVPGSKMYESYRQVMSISGMLDAAQQKELAEAQLQLADLEKQLASMPEGQRTMMEGMIGPQIESARAMASGGGFNSETVITSITVNAPIPADELDNPCGGMASQTFAPTAGVAAAAAPTPSGAPASAAAPAASDDVTSIVQQHLTTLGYNTGGVTGQMNTATAVAISQFQAENNMAVTGEASPQLAGILAARASGGGATTAPAAAGIPGETELQQAQRECLEQKIAKEKEKRENKKGFGKLVSAVTNTVNRYGDTEILADLGEVSRDIYDADATADDWAEAAKELGLSKKQVKKCMDP